MANSKKTDASRAVMEERRQQVYILRRNGLSFRDIARQLGVNHQTAHNDFTAVMQRVVEDNNGSAVEHRNLELSRLDRMLQSLAPLIYPQPVEVDGRMTLPPPSMKAIDAAIKIIAERSKLLGIYAPVETKVTGDVAFDLRMPDDYPAEDNSS